MTKTTNSGERTTYMYEVKLVTERSACHCMTHRDMHNSDHYPGAKLMIFEGPGCT